MTEWSITNVCRHPIVQVGDSIVATGKIRPTVRQSLSPKPYNRMNMALTWQSRDWMGATEIKRSAGHQAC
jgi:hypothetical protein